MSDVNYSPTLEPYVSVSPFKVWCQKVIPAVYDGSLSVYEMLCKLTAYINQIIDNMDGQQTDISNLLTAYNQLQEYVNTYFDNLNVQNEINNKLDEMAESGRLDELFHLYIPYVTPEMFGAVADGVTDDSNAFISALNSGKTVYCGAHTYLATFNLTGKIVGNNSTIKTSGLTLKANGSISGCKIITSGDYAIRVFDNQNPTFFNSVICDNVIESNVYGILFDVDVTLGNVGYANIVIEKNIFNGNGTACIATKITQPANNFPWITNVYVKNNFCVEEPYSYFYLNIPYVKIENDWQEPFVLAYFTENSYQYKAGKTEYFMSIRGFRRTYINDITFDFPGNTPYIYFQSNTGSILVDRLPSNLNTSSAFDGVDGYENCIIFVGQSLVNKLRLATYASKENPTIAYTDPRFIPFIEYSSGQVGLNISRSNNSIGFYIGVNINGFLVFGIATSNNPEWTVRQVITENNWLHGGQGARPTNPSVGSMYFVEGTNKPVWYSGAASGWVDAEGNHMFD